MRVTFRSMRTSPWCSSVRVAVYGIVALSLIRIPSYRSAHAVSKNSDINLHKESTIILCLLAEGKFLLTTKKLVRDLSNMATINV